MSVSIVACQMSVVYPENALGTEVVFQPFLNLLFGHGLIAVGCQQALACGKDGALAVALYRTAFKHEVETIDVFACNLAQIVEPAVDGVVEGCLELFAPTIETIVQQQAMPLIIDQGDKTVIAGPGVIGATDDAEHIVGSILWSHHHQAFTLGYLTSHLMIDCRNLVEYRSPVCPGMRPRQLHTFLRLPFSRQPPVIMTRFLVYHHIFGAKVQNN